MRATFYAAAIYTFMGLTGGLFYRELTKVQNFEGVTQLSVVHTHLLTLGTIMMLLVLVLIRAFNLPTERLFWSFFWVYNAGVALTTTMMVIGGTRTVLGDVTGAAHAGIAGLGHMTLTAGMILLFIWLGQTVLKKQAVIPA